MGSPDKTAGSGNNPFARQIMRADGNGFNALGAERPPDPCARGVNSELSVSYD